MGTSCVKNIQKKCNFFFSRISLKMWSNVCFDKATLKRPSLNFNCIIWKSCTFFEGFFVSASWQSQGQLRPAKNSIFVNSNLNELKTYSWAIHIIFRRFIKFKLKNIILGNPQGRRNGVSNNTDINLLMSFNLPYDLFQKHIFFV